MFDTAFQIGALAWLVWVTGYIADRLRGIEKAIKEKK